jgi:RNA polymerase sigma factor (sigma-70 family)
MVLPAPAADPGAAEARRWLGRLIRPLELSRDGVLLCLRDATPTQLGPVLRALSPAPPWSESAEMLRVCLRATEVLEVPPGSRVLLRVRSEDLDWLNIARPLFAERRLRTVLWADAQAHEGLIRRAIDFYDWVSRTVAVPAKAVPDFVVERMRMALGRGAEIAWRGLGLFDVLDALGGAPRVELHVEQPFLQLRGALGSGGLPIVTGVRTLQHVWRIRLALDEVHPRLSRNRRLWIALDPDESRRELESHDARQAGWDDACASLAAAGWRHAALLAGWVDLDPAKLEYAAAHVGVEPRVSPLRAAGPRDDDEVRRAVVREIDHEVRQTHALLESLVADGELEMAQSLAAQWEDRATSRRDSTARESAREWRTELEARVERTQRATSQAARVERDSELLDRMRAGDTVAESQFIDQYYDILRRYVATKIPGDDVFDVTQRAFESFLAAPKQDRTIPTARAFLFKIAHNKIADYYRERTKRSVEPAIVREADANVELIDVAKSVDMLSATDQSLLMMLYEGFSYAEISAVMDVPEITLRGRAHRIRQHLRGQRDADE